MNCNGCVDSFELKIGKNRLNRKAVFDALWKCIRQLGSSQYPDLTHRNESLMQTKTMAFYPFGITEFKIKDYRYGLNAGSMLLLRCRPAIVLYPEDPYALSGPGDYKRYETIFNGFIAMFNRYLTDSPLPTLDGWEVNRIDFAFQYQTPHYRETMALLQKSGRTEILRAVNNKQQPQYKDSIYIVKDKLTVNFYDKTIERKMESVEHVLRFEVQCKADFLYNMRYKGRITSLSLGELWNRSLAYSIIKKQLNKLVSDGDFVSITEAVKIIKHTRRISEPDMVLVIKLLNFSLTPSIDRTFWWDYIGLLAMAIPTDPDKLKSHVKRIMKRLNINEIAVPQEWRLDRVSNPCNIICEAYGKTNDSVDASE